MSFEDRPLSRYKDTEGVSIEGKETLGRWVLPEFLERELPDKDIVHFEVDPEFEGRPDRIAGTVYGRTQLDWVVIAFNAPRSTLNWPRAGDVIRIPMPSVLSDMI